MYSADTTIYWAILSNSLTLQSGLLDVAYATLAPSSGGVMGANAAGLEGGVVANGSFLHGPANEWSVTSLQPLCALEPLCQQSLYALQGGSSYLVREHRLPAET